MATVEQTVSVEEFAKVKGITIQGVYKKLKGKNSPEHLTVLNGNREVIRIDIAELSEEEKEKLSIIRNDKKLRVQEKRSSRQSTKDKPNKATEQSTNTDAQQKRIEELQDEVKFLRSELTKATDEIGKLTSANLLQAQQLAALQLQAHKETETVLEDTETDVDSSKQVEDIETSPNVQNVQNAPEQPVRERTVSGFIGWLKGFGRRI